MTSDRAPRSILLIGYGSDLRGDDGAGRRTAEIVADRGGEDIKVWSVHQLTPDLAPVLAEADVAIFADACAEDFGNSVRIRRLLPSYRESGHVHVGSAAELLGLSEWLYGRSPEAWAVDIAAFEFAIGDVISPWTHRAIHQAVEAIDELIEGRAPCMK